MQQFKEAVSLLGAARQRRQSSGAHPHPEEDREIAAVTRLVRSRLAPDEFARAWERGIALGLDAGLRDFDEVFQSLGAGAAHSADWTSRKLR